MYNNNNNNNNNNNKSLSSIVSIQSSLSTTFAWPPVESNGQLPLGILTSSVSTNNNNQINNYSNYYNNNNNNNDNNHMNDHQNEEYNNNNTIIKNNKKAKILQTVSSSRNKLYKIILYVCLFSIGIGFLFGYITFVLFNTRTGTNNNSSNSNSNNESQIIINANNNTSTIPTIAITTITTSDNPIQDQYYTLLSTIHKQSLVQLQTLLEQAKQVKQVQQHQDHSILSSSVANGIYIKFIVQGGQSFTIEIPNDIIQIIPNIVSQFIQRIQNQQYSNTGISLVSSSFTGTTSSSSTTGTATITSNSDSSIITTTATTTTSTTMNRQRLVCGQKTVEHSATTGSTVMTTTIHNQILLLARNDKYKLDILTKSCIGTYSVRLDNNVHESEFHIMLSSSVSNEHQQEEEQQQNNNSIDYCFGRIVQGKDTIHKMKTGLLLTDNTQINILQTEIV